MNQDPADFYAPTRRHARWDRWFVRFVLASALVLALIVALDTMARL